MKQEVHILLSATSHVFTCVFASSLEMYNVFVGYPLLAITCQFIHYYFLFTDQLSVSVRIFFGRQRPQACEIHFETIYDSRIDVVPSFSHVPLA